MEQKEDKQKLFSDLVIITTTLYKEDETSQLRSSLAVRTLQKINELSIKCVMVDGGSQQDFLESIQNLSYIKIVNDSNLGMGESRREALKIALESFPNIQYFLWVEPEKVDLISEHNLTLMLDSLRSGESDIVVPKRKSMDSYPKFQAWIEKRANNRVAEKNQLKDSEGNAIDIWFGPKMFNRKGSKYISEYQIEKEHLDKQDSIIVPVVDAKEDGARITAVEIDFTYPIEQREQEEGSRDNNARRLKQYTDIMQETGDKYWEDRMGRR